MKLFDAIVNPYNGCFIGPEQLPDTVAEFAGRLAASVEAWHHHYALIWLELPASRAELISVAVELGFAFHHCTADKLMLSKKLQADSYLPSAATHSIGVGAVVLSASGKVLLVQEKPLEGRSPGYFKLPGGMVDAKEHLVDAAIREVLEETGVAASFDSFLGLRHHHQGQFGASNLYMVCRLTAEETEPKPDPREILQARWFDCAEYLTYPNASYYNKLLVQTALTGARLSSQKVPGYMTSPDDYEIFMGLV
jgi:8-oxo-dGTP diphosphatase